MKASQAVPASDFRQTNPTGQDKGKDAPTLTNEVPAKVVINSNSDAEVGSHQPKHSQNTISFTTVTMKP